MDSEYPVLPKHLCEVVVWFFPSWLCSVRDDSKHITSLDIETPLCLIIIPCGFPRRWQTFFASLFQPQWFGIYYYRYSNRGKVALEISSKYSTSKRRTPSKIDFQSRIGLYIMDTARFNTITGEHGIPLPPFGFPSNAVNPQKKEYTIIASGAGAVRGRHVLIPLLS